MKAPHERILNCIELLSVSAIVIMLLLMSTIGVGYSAAMSEVTVTDNSVSLNITELYLTDAEGNPLTEGSFDGVSGDGGRIIDYHSVEVGGNTTYVLDSTDLYFGYGNIVTSSTNLTDVTLLCSAAFKIGSTNTPFTGISYHFVLVDDIGTETVIPSAGLSTSITDLNGKTLSIKIDGLSEAPPTNEPLIFTISVSYSGMNSVVMNSGNQLSFKHTTYDIVIDTTVPGDPDGTPVAEVTPTTVTSGGVEYPAYEVDYTATPPLFGSPSLDVTLQGNFCFKFHTNFFGNVKITVDGESKTFRYGDNDKYWSYVNGNFVSWRNIEDVVWMSSDDPITFKIGWIDAISGKFMTVIYQP